MRRTAASLVSLLWLAAAAIAGKDMPVYGAVSNGPSVLLPYVNGASPYTGVGKYHGRTACTAFFLDTVPTQEALAEAPAYALTSGRCAAALGAADEVVDGAGGGAVTFHDFADSALPPVAVPVARTAYATARDHDVAILQLDVSFRELRGRLVRPLILSRWAPEPEDPIAIIGAPAVAEGPAFLRLARCRVEGTAPLVLEHVWRWRGAAFNHCRDMLPGAAGSPVLSLVDGGVIGLVATTRAGAEAYGVCGIAHPCEPTTEGVMSRSNTTYTATVAGIDTCFTPGRRFDLRLPGCPLRAARPAGRQEN